MKCRCGYGGYVHKFVTYKLVHRRHLRHSQQLSKRLACPSITLPSPSLLPLRESNTSTPTRSSQHMTPRQKPTNNMAQRPSKSLSQPNPAYTTPFSNRPAHFLVPHTSKEDVCRAEELSW